MANVDLLPFVKLITPPSSLRLNVKTGASRIIPVYWDPKIALSYPNVLKAVAAKFASIIKNCDIEVIAGGETGGISLAAITSLETGIPWVYIRKQTKGYSTNALIEGSFRSGAQAFLIDDVVASGAGKKIFLDNSDGLLKICHVAVVLDDSGGAYGELLKNKNIFFHSLITYEQLIQGLYKNGFLSDVLYEVTQNYIANRDGWYYDKVMWKRFNDLLPNEPLMQKKYESTN